MRVFFWSWYFVYCVVSRVSFYFVSSEAEVLFISTYKICVII